MAVDGRLLYVCVTHVPLPVAFPPWVTPLYTDAAQGEGRLNLRDLSPEWERHHPLLGGAAATLAVPALLERTPGVERIGLCQYRKFVSRQRLSRKVAPSYRTMDVVSHASLTPERLAAVMDPGEEPFLLPPLYRLQERGVLGQYSAAHRAQDLLHFTAEAVDLGVLGPREARDFLTERWLVTGGLELGVYPADFWRGGITALAGVVRRCIERYPTPDEGYQKRSWAFCAERLGSWLLLRHFRGPRRRRRWQRVVQRLGFIFPGHWSRRYVGRLNLIALDEAEDYLVGGVPATAGDR